MENKEMSFKYYNKKNLLNEGLLITALGFIVLVFCMPITSKTFIKSSVEFTLCSIIIIVSLLIICYVGFQLIFFCRYSKAKFVYNEYLALRNNIYFPLYTSFSLRDIERIIHSGDRVVLIYVDGKHSQNIDLSELPLEAIEVIIDHLVNIVTKEQI